MAKSQQTVYFETSDPLNKAILERLNQPGVDKQPFLREIMNIGFLAKQQGYCVENGELARYGSRHSPLPPIGDNPHPRSEKNTSIQTSEILKETSKIKASDLTSALPKPPSDQAPTLLANLANLSLPSK